MSEPEVPRLAASIFYSSKNGRHLFLNTEAPDWVVTNTNAAFVVGLIDGIKTAQEISDVVARIDPAHDRQELRALFERLEKHGILAARSVVPPANGRRSKCQLHQVHIKFTDNCNLRCGYCYSGSGGRDKPFMKPELLDKILSDTAQVASHVTFIVSGGEPLLHKNAMEFLRRIKASGNSIHLLTNGTKVDKANACIIADTCSFVKISIDGPNEELNAVTRGRGAYQRAIRGISLLEALGVGVGVSMTVTGANIHSLPEMARRFGNKLTVQPFFRTGRGERRGDFVISGREYYEAMARIEGFEPMGKLDSHLEMLRGRGSTKCAMGDAEISISETGDVFPCQLLSNADFKGGNIGNESLRTIMESPAFNRVRSFSSLENEGCADCSIRLLCGGACRARAYMETGSLFQNSDFCEYEKLAILNAMIDNSEF